MPYLPNTDANISEMLAKIGISSVEALFHDIPARHRFPELNLPKAASESRGASCTSITHSAT